MSSASIIDRLPRSVGEKKRSRPWSRAKIIKTALIIVGDVIAPTKYEYSKVYDPGFTHGYRKGIKE